MLTYVLSKIYILRYSVKSGQDGTSNDVCSSADNDVTREAGKKSGKLPHRVEQRKGGIKRGDIPAYVISGCLSRGYVREAYKIKGKPHGNERNKKDLKKKRKALRHWG